MKKLFLPLIGLALIFTACEKNVSTTDYNSPDNDVIKTASIKCESGVLFFKDQRSFDEYVYNANRMSMPDLIKFEKSLGFESQKTIFEHIAICEYNRQIKPYIGKTDEEMKGLTFPGYSPEYISGLKSGIIKEINESEGSYMDYNISDRSKAVCLNKDGLFMVGNELFFVKGNITKSIQNATLANSRELIESGASTKNSNIKSVMADGIYTASAETRWILSGSCRASLDATFTIKTAGYTQGLYYSEVIQGFPLTIHTNAQQKKWTGKWVQYWGEETIQGPASLHLLWSQLAYGPYTSTNGLVNDFSTNYYFPSASNATLTYHPFTGAIVPNSFGYSLATAPYKGYYMWGTLPITFEINASLPGGCCGINCTVKWPL